ncbi:arylacetamide deacetylase [Brienomyrus brachyistius]|uniref:arylacetamide deacetylase n=1 Tax=Brienomyrus brachyistius TaxID=42636 RepID=UPI0020B44CDD|nr:arylacetamide deacetylase [Brienomyrus brachyistius]
MRSKDIILLAGPLIAYYVYIPIPDEIEEKWKLMITDCFFRSLMHLAELSELLGLTDYMRVMMLITVLEQTVPVSDKHVRVTEEVFDGVQVIVYEPSQQSGNGELRRAVIYLHGGGWCLGSARMGPYDLLSRQTVQELNAVVVSVEYRLAPPYHFPIPFLDVYRVVKHFLQGPVLAHYRVDAGRVAVSGDSAGGNLAAAITQQLQQDAEQPVQLKAQALLYPVLQVLDLNTPSYQQNEHMPILPKKLMVRFWSEYFTSDRTLLQAMLANSHNSLQSGRVLKYVNWTVLLPEGFHRPYSYSAPSLVNRGPSYMGTALTDPWASPLLVPDAALRPLPKAYVLTSEYDVLRDDGVMYVTRLRQAGVDVTHQHYASGFHGAFMFTVWPTDFQIGRRMVWNYIRWLKENL